MAEISNDTIVERSESVLFSELNNEFVMMDIQEGNYYGLEEPATRIWELAESPIAVLDICTTLQAEYDIAPAQCTAEVISFVRQLESHQVVKLTNA